MVLYIDACVRKNSRTRRLADCLLNTLNAPHTRLRLEECVFPTVDEAFLEKRDRLLREGDFDNPVFAYARQFAQADEIIIAAPFWDLSFPAVLKSYLEQINVVGITFRYTPEGIPEGLCRAERLPFGTRRRGFRKACAGRNGCTMSRRPAGTSSRNNMDLGTYRRWRKTFIILRTLN